MQPKLTFGIIEAPERESMPATPAQEHCVSKAVSEAVSSVAIGLTEIAGELWSAAFDLLVPCLLNLNQPAQN